MLTAYFDDSGTHLNSDLVLWYGVFGNSFQWAHFDDLWAAKLKEPSPGKPALSRFHMAQCQAADAEFAGWSRTATDFLDHSWVISFSDAGFGPTVRSSPARIGMS